MQVLWLVLSIFLQQSVSTNNLVLDLPYGSLPIIDLPAKGLCAHRGAMATHPENTLVAFQAAIDHGAHMIEFDVHLTSDGELVIIHDNSVDRTTDGQGTVAEMSLEELRSLDAGSWISSEFKGEKVPTLAETLAMMPINIWLNVHVKSTSGIGGLVAKEIMRQDRMHQAFLACSREVALEAKAVSPEIKICNMDRQSSNWDYVHLTEEYKADFIQLKGEITEDYMNLTKYLGNRNIRINYFGTDQPDEIEMLFNYGVEFPLVNNIVESIKVSSSLGIPPAVPIYR
ncbi:MAG: glycerophosphodiester phosphodiesterase [Saprospiraceae bacterium]|nr:glycerophosphodiester phosphodiesterase [Saprospiraceae bacterium]